MLGHEIGCVAALCLATALAGCDASARNATDGSVRALSALLAAASDRATSPAAGPTTAATGPPPSEASPHWPAHRFLTAEVEHVRGGPAAARASYRALAEWATKNAYHDSWGGSSLAIVALWRWLGALESATSADPAEARRALEVGEALRTTRLARGVFDLAGVMEGLPQLEEDIARRSAAVAWRIGDRQQARRLVLRYVALARDPAPGPGENAIIDDALASGVVSRDWLLVFRGRRLRTVGRYQEAQALLDSSLQTGGREARAAAGLELAKLDPILDATKRGVNRGSVAARLAKVIEDAGDPEVVQDALYTRALVLKREGSGRDLAGFERDLAALLEEFPRGRLADNALYELARQAEEDRNPARALELYDRLRRFDGPNDWIDSAHFRAAMVLYTRSQGGDLAAATTVLRDLVDRYPSGPFRMKALFWQGRFAHESGDSARARALFEKVVQESPYDYYATRSRLWLAQGAEARGQIWLDPASKRTLRAEHARGPAPPRPTGTTPYHARLAASLEAGLYAATLAEIPRLRERFPGQRLEALGLDALDRAGALPKIALLLALRQDAMAAADASVKADDRLTVSAAIGYGAQDWPLAIGLLRGSEDALEQRNAAQRTPRFLATAYPPVFADEIRKQAGEGGVRPELVYGVIRQESLFNPTALSPAGALGLFQFIPTTFDNLNSRWRLLERSGVASREGFLLTPGLNIGLGVRWLKDELLRAQKGNVALAVMEHNAGGPAVREWVRGWEQLGRGNDVEYMIETIRFAETHLFTRRVLADLAIADAVGLFEAKAPAR